MVLEILEYGNKLNKKLILIHGFESTYRSFDRIIDNYKDEYHIIVPVIPGHSVTEKKDFISFAASAAEFEEYYRKNYGETIDAVYAASMGGVFATTIWQRENIKIKKLIMESSPLLPFGKFVCLIMTKIYLSMTHNTQEREEKTLKKAIRTIVSEDDFESFLDMMDNISDTTIKRCLKEVCGFRLTPQADKNTDIYYFYGGTFAEKVFARVAKYIDKHYSKAKTFCIKGKGHCEELIFTPDLVIKRLDKIL